MGKLLHFAAWGLPYCSWGQEARGGINSLRLGCMCSCMLFRVTLAHSSPALRSPNSAACWAKKK